MYFEYGSKEIEYLKLCDKRLGEAIERIGMVYREVDKDLFSSVVHQIAGQQISTAALGTVWKRLKEKIGDITAESVSCCTKEELKSCGISFRKAEYIKEFAGKVQDGEFDIEALATMSDKEVVERLSSLRGIGTWTAEMLMTFCMQRQDVVSFGDLAILRGMRMLYHHKKIDKPLFEKYAKRYSPYGTVASLYLWAIAGGALPELSDPAPKKKAKVKKKKKRNAEEENMRTMIKYAYYACPYGWVRIGYEEENIVNISSTKQKPDSSQEENRSELSDRAFHQLSEYFEGKRQAFDLPLKLYGTKFQTDVWNALLEIPYGETRSYQQIAAAIGNSKACRAVGMANRNNPIWIVVPCHRVIGASGSLTGYAGGVEMKRSLLELEQRGKQQEKQ